MNAIPLPETPRRDRLGVRPRSGGSGTAAIAAVALRGLVLVVIATLLVLVALPAALVAAGT